MTAGVPPRVEAGVKAALLDLVDRALEQGWTTARACAVLELDGRRCRRWQHRRSAGRLDDSTAGGAALHAITPFERRAILELFERWGDIDGGYRKLAHRGSYESLVWVSPSTLYRVLAAQGLVLPARPQRRRRRRSARTTRCRCGSRRRRPSSPGCLPGRTTATTSSPICPCQQDFCRSRHRRRAPCASTRPPRPQTSQGPRCGHRRAKPHRPARRTPRRRPTRRGAPAK